MSCSLEDELGSSVDWGEGDDAVTQSAEHAPINSLISASIPREYSPSMIDAGITEVIEPTDMHAALGAGNFCIAESQMDTEDKDDETEQKSEIDIDRPADNVEGPSPDDEMIDSEKTRIWDEMFEQVGS